MKRRYIEPETGITEYVPQTALLLSESIDNKSDDSTSEIFVRDMKLEGSGNYWSNERGW